MDGDPPLSIDPAPERTAEAFNTPFEPVLRPRVIERLRHAARRRIALVVAPAGFGKSVAIRQYLETDGIEHLRFSVRKEHDSLVGFLRGLVVALEPIAPKASKSVAGAYEKASRGSTPVRDLAAWVAALLSRYEGTIVIDDLHFAVGDHTKSLLSEIIDRSSAHTRWIVAARTSVDLPAASWLAYGLREDALGQEELSLTVDEALQACDLYGIRTSRSDMSKLVEMTQGWPVALSFAMRMSMNHVSLTAALHGSRETTYTYLADQVFKSLTPAHQTFLLKTCIFQRMDTLILKAVAPDSDHDVRTLRNVIPFVMLDGQDGYRYHDLFKEFLEHLLRSRGKKQFADMIAYALDTLLDLGYYDQALTISLAHSVKSYIREILESNGWALLEAGAIDRVTAALRLIDKEYLSRSPVLLSLQAKIDDGSGSYESADAYFKRAFSLAEAVGVLEIIAERWAVSLVNRFLLEQAYDVVSQVNFSRCADVNTVTRLLGLKSAIEVRLGRNAEAEACLREGLDRIPTITDSTTLALFFHYAAYVSLWLGRSIEARDYCLKALVIFRELGLYDLGGRASSILHEIAASRDDVRELIYALDEMTRFARMSGDLNLRQFALFSDYDAATERGDFTRSQELEVAVRAEIPLDEERWAQTVIAADAMRLASGGRFSDAYELESQYRLELCPVPARALRAAELALYSSCSGDTEIAQREAELAIGLIESEAARSQSVGVRMIKAISLTSLALGKQGNLERAKALLRRAGSTASLRGSARLLINAVMASLSLSEASGKLAISEITLSTLENSRLGGYAALIRAVGASQNRVLALGRLTESELRIVNLLQAGLSSKEIAARLGRSRLTVDTHVKAILRKLGCSSRREAVARLMDA
jgi:DNA-binding CsgD family transcriptional regulator